MGRGRDSVDAQLDPLVAVPCRQPLTFAARAGGTVSMYATIDVLTRVPISRSSVEARYAVRQKLTRGLAVVRVDPFERLVARVTTRGDEENVLDTV